MIKNQNEGNGREDRCQDLITAANRKQDDNPEMKTYTALKERKYSWVRGLALTHSSCIHWEMTSFVNRNELGENECKALNIVSVS